MTFFLLTNRLKIHIVKKTNTISITMENEILKREVNAEISPPLEDEPLITNVVKIAAQVNKAAKPRNFFQKGATIMAAIAAIHKITTRL